MPVSHWSIAQAPTATIARTDVVVVGAGVCGVSAALALRRRGLKVEVLEGRSLAAGASSRNAGFLMRGAAENYGAAIGLYGRERARMVWKWTEENLEGLRGEGIETLGSYRRVPSCLLALGEEELTQLRQSVKLLREDGFDVNWQDRGDDSAWRGAARGGLVNPDDAACNPVELMGHLAGRLSAPIRELHEVLAIEDGGPGPLTIRTTRGILRTARVLLCTNAYASQLASSLLFIRPRRGQMLALREPGIRLDCSYYANHGYEYFRQAADGTVVVGGCRREFAEQEVGFDDAPGGPVQMAIERFAKEFFALREPNIIARWAGTMGFSPDGLPLIGPVAEWPSGRVWFCGGFTGHGMSMAYKAAAVAVGAMLDESDNPLPLSRVEKPIG